MASPGASQVELSLAGPRDLGALVSIGRLKVISAFGISLLVFLVNGQAFFANRMPEYFTPILVYSVMFLVAALTGLYLILAGDEGKSRKAVRGLRALFGESVFRLLFKTITIMVASLTVIILYLMATHARILPMARDLVLPTIYFQGFVAVPVEELMFRGVMPQVTGVIPAQVAFGLFHWTAYGGDPAGIIMAILLGFAFYYVSFGVRLNKKPLGLGAGMGMHLAWNFAVLGVLASWAH